jgi:hypothetical protein
MTKKELKYRQPIEAYQEHFRSPRFLIIPFYSRVDV